MVKRSMTVQEITKNLRLYTEDQRKIEKDPKTLRQEEDEELEPQLTYNNNDLDFKFQIET